MTSGIYKITSPKNKIYIGQSINVEARIVYYKNLQSKAQPKLHSSLKKYGFEKHKFEIIIECEKEKLNEFEIYYIQLYQCFNNKNGLNLRSGGGQYSIHSEESKNKNRIAHLGKKASESTKLKMSNERLGIKNPFFNKTHSKIVIEKLRNRNLGMKYSKEINNKKAHIGENNPFAKLVLNIETGIYYGCIREAAESFNINPKGLARKLSGERKNKTSFINA